MTSSWTGLQPGGLLVSYLVMNQSGNPNKAKFRDPMVKEVMCNL